MPRNSDSALLKQKSYFSRFGLPKTFSSLPDDKRGILKVKTLQDSLNSCKVDDGNCRRSSLQALKSSKKKSRWGLSFHKGSSLFTSFRPSSSKPKGPLFDASLTRASDESQSLHVIKKVSFANTETRLYKIEPDDNPAVTGKGPAIHLGWEFQVEEPVTVDDYEAHHRGPTKKIQDLKFSMKEREELLLQSGATKKELMAFAKRVRQAKTQRMATVEALNVYGKANMAKAELRAVKQENFWRQ